MIELRGGIVIDEVLEMKFGFGIVVTPELDSKVTSVSTGGTGGGSIILFILGERSV